MYLENSLFHCGWIVLYIVTRDDFLISLRRVTQARQAVGTKAKACEPRANFEDLTSTVAFHRRRHLRIHCSEVRWLVLPPLVLAVPPLEDD
jgi:hypothetical protein